MPRRYKPMRKKSRQKPAFKAAESIPQYSSYRADNHREKYPSVDKGGLWATKSKRQQYTGTYVKGLSTMHKSNEVPITNFEQAKEINNMRRTQ